MMGDVIATAVVVLLGLMGVAAMSRDLDAQERQVVALSFVARVVSAFALVWMTRYFFGGGDMLAYHRNGVLLADLLYQDFSAYAPDMVRYALGREVDEPMFFLSGSSTGSMFGVTAWLMFFMGGDALYGACMTVAMANLLANLTIYRVFRRELPARYHHAVCWLVMLLPSMVFWTSGLLKEAMAMVGLAAMLFATSSLIRGKRHPALLVLMGLGVGVVSLFKAYILFPFILGAVVWAYTHRAWTRTGRLSILDQPLYIIGLGLLAIAGMWGLGVLFPRFALQNVVEEAANLQGVGARTLGGSSYGAAPVSKSLLGQLLYAPIAMSYSLFRPLPFDVHNAAVLLNAAEMTAVVGLWLRMIFVRPISRTVSLILQSPFLMFCILFVLTFSVAVGLTTTNMGTLSRYRVPMMPFYLGIIWILGSALPVSGPHPGRGGR